MKYMPTLLPKDIDKYFYDREKYIKQINTNLEMLEMDIANQFLITGYRGVGKTALTKKNHFKSTRQIFNNIHRHIKNIRKEKR